MLKLFITTHNTILLVKAGYSVFFQSQVLLVEAKVHERYRDLNFVTDMVNLLNHCPVMTFMAFSIKYSQLYL